MSDKVDFLNADKYKSLLQIGTMILVVIANHFQSSQNSKFAILLPWHGDKHQSFLQVDFIIFGIKVSCKFILSLLMNIITHSQSIQSNNFAISSQDFKKEVKNGVHFLYEVKHESWQYRFQWKWSDMYKVAKIGSWNSFAIY